MLSIHQLTKIKRNENENDNNEDSEKLKEVYTNLRSVRCND